MSTRADAHTQHPFFQLREKLVPLRFDLARDVPSSSQPFVQDYLHFYQLNFAQDLCSFHAMGTFTSADYTLVAHYWLPSTTSPKGTVYVLHGYYDHSGLFHHLIRFLLEQQFAVVAYDQPGHGLSSGERVSIHHFAEYVDVLQQCLQGATHFPKPWNAIGLSTGGGVLLHLLLVERAANPFDTIALLAPLVKPAGWASSVWLYRALHHFVKKFPRHYADNSHDADFLDFCRHRDPFQSTFLSVAWVGALKEWIECFPSLAPTQGKILLLQGDNDTTVDWRANVALIGEKINGLEVAMIAGARHHLTNESGEFRERVFAKLHDFLLASSK